MSKTEQLSASSGFSQAERDAMKKRADELRAEKGGAKKADSLQAVLDAIAEMPDNDRVIAERIHALVTRVAPDLLPRTWYGMPAYTDGKNVVCYLKPAVKFETRYAQFGFEDAARLDDGDMWPVVFAIVNWTDAVEKKIEKLVRKAVA